MNDVKHEKFLWALDPVVVLPPHGCSRYEPKWCSRSLRGIFVWLSKNQESGLVMGKKTEMKEKMGITRSCPDGGVNHGQVVRK